MKTGDTVISLKGHDKGALYVVTETEGEFLLLCDGKCKLLTNPKKKNMRKELKSLFH